MFLIRIFLIVINKIGLLLWHSHIELRLRLRLILRLRLAMMSAFAGRAGILVVGPPP